MSVESLQVLGYLGITVAILAIWAVLDVIFRGLSNWFADRSNQFRHRIGTQLPRVLN